MKRILSLNGSWDFVADLDPKYHAIHGGFQDPNRNRRHWLKVPVPGVWQKYGERYDIFEGVCWFAREFDLGNLAEGASAWLRFGAVNYQCRVFLNGNEVGSHEGGYTEFVLDATAHLQSGTNHIAVRVDNRATTTKWPPCLGYFNYGGIHRDVTIEVLDGPGLGESLKVSAEPTATGGRLIVSGTTLNADPELTVSICCENVRGDSKLDSGTFQCRLEVAGAKAWTPDEPHLYAVTVSLQKHGVILDSTQLRCGFRKVTVQAGRIHMNADPIVVKGVGYVYDSPVHGLVMARDQIETDISLIKEMGCNAVRCHYPMAENFYNACDRAGVMVWIEPNVYCLHPRDDEVDTPFSDPEWQCLAERMIVEMIATARNHACVVIYGIGNECNTNNPEAEPFFKLLADRVRSEDPTRLLSYAALYGIVGPLADMVDILGINSYWGWYDKCFGGKGLAPETSELSSEAGDQERMVRSEPIDLTRAREMLENVLKTHSDLTLLLTEFGADSVPGYFSRSRDLWSEEYHADLLREMLALADEFPEIAGTFAFGFSDYRDPSKIPNGYWNELNLKGVVTYERKKRLAFEAIRGRYRLAE